jgi:predicted TIM-barrel fold metal-dependent hydrolase
MTEADLMMKFADPAMREIGPVVPRMAQRGDKLKRPKGAAVISADDHWEISRDIFRERFPKHLKEKAPEVWFDRYWRVGYRGQLENFALGEKIERAIEISTGAGVGDQKLHLEHMDIEGVSKSIMYPQSLLSFIRLPDLEVLEQMYRTYNEYIAEMQAASNGRTFGVGIFANWWDPAAAERSMQQIVDLGLRTVMAPVNPGKSIDGSKIHYGDPVMDRFWSVIEASGLPFSFHVGEGMEDTEHRGGMGSYMLVSFSPFRKPLGQVIFGGVFDRHPKLKVVFAEGGIAWLLGALQDAEMLYDTMGNGKILDRMEHRPTYYWHNHCYATFQNDLIGLKNVDYLGADRIMWGSDYPHTEGTFGYTSNSLQSILGTVSEDQARMIMGGTAAKLYKLQ